MNKKLDKLTNTARNGSYETTKLAEDNKRQIDYIFSAGKRQPEHEG